MLREVFARRIGPINSQRLDLLDQLEADAGDQPLQLEQILEAFLRPPLSLHSKGDVGGKHIMCLMGRLEAEPRASELKMLFFQEFKEVFERFIPALQRILPKVSAQDIIWRFIFTVGSMAHLMSTSDAGDILNHASGGLCDSSDTEANLQRLVAFSAAGFRAPSHDAPQTN